MKTRNVITAAIVLAAVYFGAAYFLNWWPFKKGVTLPKKNGGQSTGDPKAANWLRTTYNYLKAKAADAGLPTPMRLADFKAVNDYLQSKDLTLADESAFDWLDTIGKDVQSRKFKSFEDYFKWLESQS